MKILKYKKGSKGKYKVILEDGRELSLYEEVILKYELLLSKEIDEKDLIAIDKCNQEWDVYYVALNSINHRFKSVYELRLWLLKKEYPKDLIDPVIDKLIKQGYLNDRSYAKSFINTQMITTHNGPYKISRELAEKKVSSEIIEEEIQVFGEEEQEERVRKIIERGIKSNRNKGGFVLKQKIYQDLKNLGYEISLLNRIIDSYEFPNDSSIAKREYEKYYKKYSQKYSGQELELKIREKLYQKGLKYEKEFDE